jgi:hypothetical protein
MQRKKRKYKIWKKFKENKKIYISKENMENA